MDRARVKKLAGDYQMDTDGKLIEPGVPIQLSLEIKAIETTEELPTLEKNILQPEEIRTISYGATSFNKRFAVVYL